MSEHKKDPNRRLDDEAFDLSSLEPDSDGKPLPASSDVQDGPVDYAKATDYLLAKEGEVAGQPVDREWQIRALEDKLGIQLEDSARSDILTVLRESQAEPQEALKKLKEAKYSEIYLQPVAELIDNLVEVYDRTVENINAMRAEIAENVDQAEDITEEVIDDVTYKNSLFNSLDASLKIPEIVDTDGSAKPNLNLSKPLRAEDVPKVAKAAKRARIASDKRPAERAKFATMIKSIFDKIEQEAKANNGKIKISPKELQKRIDWYVSEYGFDKAVFDYSVNTYLQYINATIEEKEEEPQSINVEEEFGDQMLE